VLDDERVAEAAFEPLVEILRQPGWQERYRQGRPPAGLAFNGDPPPVRAPRLDLVGQREHNRGALEPAIVNELAGKVTAAQYPVGGKGRIVINP